MLEFGARRLHPELKELVMEASRALACLDADRLEELALSCKALNSDLAEADLAADTERRRSLVRQAREAAGDMAILGRVLEATRANLNVIKRLRQLRGPGREPCLEYGEAQTPAWRQTENSHGDN
jgi:hypothetical protein